MNTFMIEIANLYKVEFAMELENHKWWACILLVIGEEIEAA